MVSLCNCLCYWLGGLTPVLYSCLLVSPDDWVWADIEVLSGDLRLTGERQQGAVDSSLLGHSSNSSRISVNLAGDGDPLSKERAGKDRISMASLRQVRYPHLEKSLSYRSGGNWGNGSLGRPLGPAAYDEGTEVHPDGVRIQSTPAMGAGLVVGTGGLPGGDEPPEGELMVLMAASKRS